jgi:hypothetical protein
VRPKPIAMPEGHACTIQHLFTRLKHRGRPHPERLKIGTVTHLGQAGRLTCLRIRRRVSKDASREATNRSASDRSSRSAGTASMAADSNSTDAARSCAITIGSNRRRAPSARPTSARSSSNALCVAVPSRARIRRGLPGPSNLGGLMRRMVACLLAARPWAAHLAAVISARIGLRSR